MHEDLNSYWDTTALKYTTTEDDSLTDKDDDSSSISSCDSTDEDSMVVARARPPSLTPLRRPGSKEDTRRLHQCKAQSTSRSHASMPQASSKAAASSATGTSGGPRPPLRRGKWTFQEEAYVSRIIYDFNHGLLPLAAGTTLRAYLSDTLNCDPMR